MPTLKRPFTLPTSLFAVFFLLLPHGRLAAQYAVFKKDGYVGLSGPEGRELIPATYERIGWSDGSQDVKEGLIGVYDRGKWGLISTKNKQLTPQQYYTLVPFGANDFKASVKGRFSNRLFYGILSASGEVKISFNYFSLEKKGANYLVSTYENKRTQYGLISEQEELIVPLVYRSVEALGRFYLGRQYEGGIDLFSINGKKLAPDIDSLQQTTGGLVCYRNGLAGFFSSSGSKTHDFLFKKIEVAAGSVITHPFPKWEVRKEGRYIRAVDADSIALRGQGIWIRYNNGAQQITSQDTIPLNPKYQLQAVGEGHLLVKHAHTKKWSVISHTGQPYLSGYDAVLGNGHIYWAQTSGGWRLLDKYGQSLQKWKASKVADGISGQFLAQAQRAWGIIDQYGLAVTSFKFDEILPEKDHYKVKYLDRWGIMSPHGAWIVPPKYDEVFVFKDYLIGRVGHAYTYHAKGLSWKSVYRPQRMSGSFLMIGDSGVYGAINKRLEVVIPIQYPQLDHINPYLIAQLDSTTLHIYTQEGALIPSEEIQEVSAAGADDLMVKKKDRWGFLDGKGRMIISNRYEAAQPFSEGLAPIRLRGRWGFINEEESLVIQPLYDEVGPFREGVAQVSLAQNKGLINKTGEALLEIKWKRITPTAYGNYKIMNKKNKFGLVSSEGVLLLRADYSDLQDLGDRVLVTKQNKKGVLNYAGRELIKIQYDDIKIAGDYLFLK